MTKIVQGTCPLYVVGLVVFVIQGFVSLNKESKKTLHLLANKK